MISKNVKHFSLIELLVVACLIAILASLLQPSLVSVISSAHRAECSNNLKTNGQAIHLYADDFNNIINLSWIPGTTSQKHVFDPPRFINGTWKNTVTGLFNDGKKGYLEPYLGDNSKLYICPGSVFPQGVEAFSAPGFWVQRAGTYTSTSRITYMKKDRQDYHMFSDAYDKAHGWDQYSQKIMLYDPVRIAPGWIISGGRYDLTDAVIHNNYGVLPVLMLDGHVMQFDQLDMKMRPSLPEFVNRIYDQL